MANAVPLDNPFDGRLAVDDVFVGFRRDVLNDDVAIVDDDGLVLLGLEAHLVNDPEVVIVRRVGGVLVETTSCRVSLGFHRDLAVSMDDDIRTGSDGFVVEMEVGEFLAVLVEVHEVVHIIHDGDAGEGLFKVGGKALPVVGRVQESIDIVENHLLGDVPGTAIAAAHLLENPICDAVTTDVFALRLFVIEEGELFVFVFFVPIEGEALAFFYEI